MITLVNTFEVTGAAEEFELEFDAVAELMSTQPGFRTHRLLVSDRIGGRYVNVAEWDDELALHNALRQPGFRQHAAKLQKLANAQPQVYHTVFERGRS
jgi:long-chain acyl-CoA synthetase